MLNAFWYSYELLGVCARALHREYTGMSIDTYLIGSYISLGSGESLLGSQHVKTWASVTLVPISTLLRACMCVVNLYVSYIVSHHLFTITYIIRVTNIINIAQTILKCQYRIFNSRQICRQSYINLILWAQQTLKQEMGSCWSSCWSRSSPHLRRWFCYLNGVLWEAARSQPTVQITSTSSHTPTAGEAPNEHHKTKQTSHADLTKLQRSSNAQFKDGRHSLRTYSRSTISTNSQISDDTNIWHCAPPWLEIMQPLLHGVHHLVQSYKFFVV
jgi:hypothetical protein